MVFQLASFSSFGFVLFNLLCVKIAQYPYDDVSEHTCFVNSETFVVCFSRSSSALTRFSSAFSLDGHQSPFLKNATKRTGRLLIFQFRLLLPFDCPSNPRLEFHHAIISLARLHALRSLLPVGAVRQQQIAWFTYLRRTSFDVRSATCSIIRSHLVRRSSFSCRSLSRSSLRPDRGGLLQIFSDSLLIK